MKNWMPPLRLIVSSAATIWSGCSDQGFAPFATPSAQLQLGGPSQQALDAAIAAQERHTPAIADLDGDGRMEIASAGYGNGVRAFDPKDGTPLWSLAAPAPTEPKVSSADIDGRRGDELLYVAGNTLVALTGSRAAGSVLWTWRGPANLSLPAVADLDGDGLAEILLRAADGSVLCLDGGAAP